MVRRGEVRGRGLLIGVELVKDDGNLTPAKEEMDMVMEHTRERGLLIGRGGLFGNVVRFSPPYCITKSDCDRILSVMDEVFSRVGCAHHK